MRGYHVALEGAQKLKEISYIHAEAYPAAELKHGPLALVSADIPTVVIAPGDELWDKNMGSIAEIRARAARSWRSPIRSGSDPRRHGLGRRADDRAGAAADPACGPPPALAYHVALALGRDIDKPRNLAKSVTVE